MCCFVSGRVSRVSSDQAAVSSAGGGGTQIPGLLDLEAAAADIDAALGLTTGPGMTDDIDPMSCDVNVRAHTPNRVRELLSVG